MAIVLTNGKHYIAHNKSGAVIKVMDIEQAYDFGSVGRAIHQRKKAPKKCAGYYYIDTVLFCTLDDAPLVRLNDGVSAWTEGIYADYLQLFVQFI